MRNDKGIVRVQMVNAMFRMKMLFEDAGNWAFMKNMGMPGSIADEIQAQVSTGLESGGDVAKQGNSDRTTVTAQPRSLNHHGAHS